MSSTDITTERPREKGNVLEYIRSFPPDNKLADRLEKVLAKPYPRQGHEPNSLDNHISISRVIVRERSMEKNGSSFSEWTSNHVWFRTHYQRLARNYDRQNIAVYQGRVVDHDKNLTRLLDRVKKNYPEDRVVVEYVSRRKRELIL